MPKKSSEKQLYWQAMVNRQASSGLSIREFCRKEGVSEPSFYMWRKKLGEPSRRKARAESLNHRGAESRNGREFIPLSLLETSGSVEVVHPLGYWVRITGEANITSLERILDVLDGRNAR